MHIILAMLLFGVKIIDGGVLASSEPKTCRND